MKKKPTVRKGTDRGYPNPTWFIMNGGALDGLGAAWYTHAEA